MMTATNKFNICSEHRENVILFAIVLREIVIAIGYYRQSYINMITVDIHEKVFLRFFIWVGGYQNFLINIKYQLIIKNPTISKKMLMGDLSPI